MSRRLDISHTAPPTRPIYPWDPFIWSASWFFYHENESKNNKMSPGSVASYDLKNDINLFYSRCFRMLDTDYKFYLAFENSNCKDYITEKFFVNGLGWVLLFTTKSQLWNNFKFSHNVLPIVMGASVEEYRRAAPLNSFIHVNQFKGPKELAEYLHELDQNDDKYNSYFQVK